MKVGDLVRHEMYNESKVPALVIDVDIDGTVSMIKIFDLDDGVATWDSGRDYEVISEAIYTDSY